jgi:hypothetical protein
VVHVRDDGDVANLLIHEVGIYRQK